MDATPMATHYIARVWEGEDRPGLDYINNEDWRRNIIAAVLIILPIWWCTNVLIKIIERSIIRHFPTHAERWACRAPGQKWHRAEWLLNVFAWITIISPMLYQTFLAVLGIRRRQYHAVAHWSYIGFASGCCAMILSLVAVGGYRFVVRKMEPKTQTPRRNPNHPAYKGVEDSVTLAKYRWALKRVQAMASLPKLFPSAAQNLDLGSRSRAQERNVVPIAVTGKEVFHAITAQPDFEHLSFEELRLLQQGEIYRNSRLGLLKNAWSGANWLKLARSKSSNLGAWSKSTENEKSFGRMMRGRGGLTVGQAAES